MKITNMRRYMCGCRGIPVDPQNPSTVLVLQPCCEDSIQPSVREMLTPEISEEVPPNDAADIIEKLARLVYDGRALIEVRKHLRGPD